MAEFDADSLNAAFKIDYGDVIVPALHEQRIFRNEQLKLLAGSKDPFLQTLPVGLRLALRAAVRSKWPKKTLKRKMARETLKPEPQSISESKLSVCESNVSVCESKLSFCESAQPANVFP